jgi:hypothetical protein
MSDLDFAFAPWLGKPKFRELLNCSCGHARVPLTKFISDEPGMAFRMWGRYQLLLLFPSSYFTFRDHAPGSELERLSSRLTVVVYLRNLWLVISLYTDCKQTEQFQIVQDSL